MACVAAMLSMALLFGIQYRHTPSDTHIKTMFALHRDSWALYRKIKPELTIAYACAILNCVMFAFFSVFIPYFAGHYI